MAAQNSTGKAPAFQFYPKDFLSDSNVVAMSMQERGVYITLICICWDDGSIPADVAALARLCATPPKAFARCWPAVSKCFKLAGDRLIHPRLQRERQKQREFRQRQADASRKRWDSRATPRVGNPSAIPKPSSASAICDLQSLSADSSQGPADARSKRPIFKGTQFVVFEWQLDDLRRMLGAHFEPFDVHEWFFKLDEQARAAALVVPQRDGGKWLQEQTLAEAIRRGLPVAMSAAAPMGKTAGNAAAAARFVARRQG